MSEPRMKSRTYGVAGVILVAALALAGCSSSPAPTEIADAPAASGENMAGSGYDFTAPEGWSVPEDMTFPDVDIIAMDTTDTDSFTDNINVVVSPAEGFTADQAEASVVGELEGAGFTKVAILDRIMVAETETTHVSAIGSINGNDYQIEQYFIAVPDSNGLVVTFSFSTTVSEPDRKALSESVLATWALA